MCIRKGKTMKKIIKLINNERMNNRVTSAKASGSSCTGTATDFCSSIDNAFCSVGAVDLCVKDYAACTRQAVDYCAPEYDLQACMGYGATDY